MQPILVPVAQNTLSQLIKVSMRRPVSINSLDVELRPTFAVAQSNSRASLLVFVVLLIREGKNQHLAIREESQAHPEKVECQEDGFRQGLASDSWTLYTNLINENSQYSNIKTFTFNAQFTSTSYSNNYSLDI